jgi:DNA-binding CsgD family transcriptional regulator
MAVHLSSRKIAQLQAATAILLSPFSYESGEEWRRAVCAALNAIVDSCGAVFGFSLPDERLLGGEPDVVEVLDPFMPPSGWLRDGYLKSLRARGRGVADWRDAYDPDFLRKTDFYHEIVRPNRLFAPTMLMGEVRGSLLGAAVFHYFEDEKKADARAGERKAILRLLVPAFQAGVSAYAAVKRQRDTLKRFGELAQVALSLYDQRGRLLHESRSFEQLLARDVDAVRIRGEAGRLVSNLAASLSSKNPIAHLDHPIRRRLTTHGGTYVISAMSFEDIFGTATVLGVVIEDLTVPRIDPERLMSEYRLTKREVQTATLMQRRLSTKEIAAALGVSVNTARRHTEHVLSKLGVHSRSDLATWLNGAPGQANSGLPWVDPDTALLTHG